MTGEEFLIQLAAGALGCAIGCGVGAAVMLTVWRIQDGYWLFGKRK